MKIGILGAGQLARMLVQAGQSLQKKSAGTVSELVILRSASSSSECVQDLSVPVRELSENSAGLAEVIQDLDFITFENEFIELDNFRRIQQDLSVKFFPSLEVIALIQDKLQQKRLMDRLGVPTASWRQVSTEDAVDLAVQTPLVLKWARQGYDGKGTFLLREKSQNYDDFLHRAREKGIEVYAEEFIDYKIEVALVCARNWSGECAFYPLVETRQINGICHDIRVGDKSLQAYEKTAQEFALKILEDLNYVGVLALEMFVDQEGQILVNELAPRVHNSGHWTLAGAEPSQFEAHLLAGMDAPLLPPKITSPFVGMWNLVPMGEVDRTYQEGELPSLAPGYQLSWYKKTRLRKGRKMGHINFVSQDPGQFEKMREYMSQWERTWNERLQKK